MKYKQNDNGFAVLIVLVITIVLLSASLAYSFYSKRIQVNDLITNNKSVTTVNEKKEY